MDNAKSKLGTADCSCGLWPGSAALLTGHAFPRVVSAELRDLTRVKLLERIVRHVYIGSSLLEERASSLS